MERKKNKALGKLEREVAQLKKELFQKKAKLKLESLEKIKIEDLSKLMDEPRAAQLQRKNITIEGHLRYGDLRDCPNINNYDETEYDNSRHSVYQDHNLPNRQHIYYVSTEGNSILGKLDERRFMNSNSLVDTPCNYHPIKGMSERLGANRIPPLSHRSKKELWNVPIQKGDIIKLGWYDRYTGDSNYTWASEYLIT